LEKEYFIKSPAKVYIKVTDKTITISRKGLVNLSTHGLKGDKTIPIKNITSVQLKKPGALTNDGYIQFGVLGGVESKGGLFSATQDENTIMFTKAYYDDMLELKEYIESYEDNIKTAGNTQNEKSPAEKVKELKELLDLGILTQEEFDAKKKELLEL